MQNQGQNTDTTERKSWKYWTRIPTKRRFGWLQILVALIAVASINTLIGVNPENLGALYMLHPLMLAQIALTIAFIIEVISLVWFFVRNKLG